MQKSIDIFLGYAVEDRDLCLEVKKRLRWLEREGLVRTWHEYSVGAGMEREKEIYRYLELAHIILLFISADFIDADFCYCEQLKRAMERHKQGKARVIPIILRSVYWQETPLGKLQALPRNNLPIKNWPDLDEVLAEVEQYIRVVVKELVTEEYIQEVRYLFDKKQYELAIEACECALRWVPTSVSAYRLKGFALLQLNRTLKLLYPMSKSLKLMPSLLLYIWKKVTCFITSGDITKLFYRIKKLFLLNLIWEKHIWGVVRLFAHEQENVISRLMSMKRKPTCYLLQWKMISRRIFE